MVASVCHVWLISQTYTIMTILLDECGSPRPIADIKHPVINHEQGDNDDDDEAPPAAQAYRDTCVRKVPFGNATIYMTRYNGTSARLHAFTGLFVARVLVVGQKCSLPQYRDWIVFTRYMVLFFMAWCLSVDVVHNNLCMTQSVYAFGIYRTMGYELWINSAAFYDNCEREHKCGIRIYVG